MIKEIGQGGGVAKDFVLYPNDLVIQTSKSNISRNLKRLCPHCGTVIYDYCQNPKTQAELLAEGKVEPMRKPNAGGMVSPRLVCPELRCWLAEDRLSLTRSPWYIEAIQNSRDNKNRPQIQYSNPKLNEILNNR